MNLQNIICICPDCSAEFTLDRILGEQALATLQSEVSNLSEKEIQKELVLSARPLLKMKKSSLKKKYIRNQAKREELNKLRNAL